MQAVSPGRTRNELVSLSHRGLGVHDFVMAAARLLRRVVAFDGVCVVTMDPATLLLTGHVIENGLPDEASPRLAEIEVAEPDFNKFTELAGGKVRAASLSEATAGDLDRSRRHRELRGPHGFADELRAPLASASATWGGIVLMREAGRPDFTPADANRLASLTGDLGEGLRRAIFVSSVSGDEDDDIDAGLLLLADDNSIEMANTPAQEWLADLREDGGRDEHLPFVVQTVADQARNIAAGRLNGDARASARFRSRSGAWVLVRGSMLGEGPDARTAVMLEAARAPELAPLIADSYGLTARERRVTGLVAQGLPTREIAKRLYLSPFTVQDHLKSVFDKVGVRTRGELVATLFFEHYAPRMGLPQG
jgi:DNA-binding CsgD family transcriptional regulator